MASVEKRERDGKLSYVVRYRDPLRKQRAKSFARKVDAERFARSVEVDKERGSYVDQAKGRMMLSEYVALWRSQRRSKPLTGESMDNHLDRHLLPGLGHLRLSELGPVHIRAWAAQQIDRRAASSVRVTTAYLSSILATAVDDGYLPRSPMPRKLSLPVEHKELVPLLPEQVSLLARSVPERYKAYVLLLAGTGLRQGEALGLTWDRINTKKQTLRVDRQLVRTKQGMSLATPKTKASNRTIPLPNVVALALLDHKRAFGVGDGGLVFCSSTKGYLNRTQVGTVLRKAVAKAGLPEGTSSHDLRHFYASLLIYKGQSVKAVQRRLGHSSAVTTLNIYAHLWPDSEADTIIAVDDALSL